jgi:hypothetical protein
VFPREPAPHLEAEELPDTVLHGVPLAAMETQRVAMLMAERAARPAEALWRHPGGRRNARGWHYVVSWLDQ